MFAFFAPFREIVSLLESLNRKVDLMGANQVVLDQAIAALDTTDASLAAEVTQLVNDQALYVAANAKIDADLTSLRNKAAAAPAEEPIDFDAELATIQAANARSIASIASATAADTTIAGATAGSVAEEAPPANVAAPAPAAAPAASSASPTGSSSGSSGSSSADSPNATTPPVS